MENEDLVVEHLADCSFKNITVQCVGPSFVKYLTKSNFNVGGILSHSSSADEISESNINIEIDIDYLRSLDPKDWKDQDHYAVLGLKNVRNNASDDDIKRAYRKIVLKHHPDKRKAQGESINQDDDYFTCITRAYETLGNPTKRRSYDSVDPEFDDTLPTQTEIEKNFFKIFDEQFTKNARWSEKRNVPKIGTDSSTRGHVDHFYNFWYNFDSWREYSYMDEEDKEKGQDRDERRWIEKQNKTVRAKRKKEEMARIRTLVDLAYNNDPRIVRFKQEEKDKKLAAKRAKQDAAQAQKAEEEKLLKEALLAKEKADVAEQKRIEAIRLEREQQKRALKKEKKSLRDLVKSNDYYATNDKEKIKNMEGIEKICELLKSVEIQELNQTLPSGGRDLFLKVLKETEEKLEEERKALFEKKKTIISEPSTTPSSVKIVDKAAMWNNENVHLLIKAVNLFPAGTTQRWEVVANFMNQHGTDVGERKFNARDVLNKAKDLQSGDYSKSILKNQANQNAFESFEKNKREPKYADESDISVKLDATTNKQKKSKQNGVAAPPASDTAITSNGVPEPKKMSPPPQPATAPTPVKIEKEVSKAWTTDEQALLEQAIKTYPITTADRWDRIAECIPNRSKKDCLRRVKELVDRVNAKREAQQTVK